jgi:hypothetical protein
MRSRYWRRNARQAGSFSASVSLFGADLRPSPLDLGGVEPGARVDLEPCAGLVGRQAVPCSHVTGGLDGRCGVHASTDATADRYRDDRRGEGRAGVVRADHPERLPERRGEVQGSNIGGSTAGDHALARRALS